MTPNVYYQDATLTLLLGDAVEQLRTLPDGSVDCVVTSPPYFGLRDYDHFAAFPARLPRRCILAGCRPGGTVLDPFSGAGTTALVASQLGRRAIGIDLVAQYHDIALRRMSDAPLPFEDGEAS